MDPKETPDSQITTTKSNPRQKKTRESGRGANKIEPSPLKKNEFAVILFGALLITIVIFFLFFRSSGNRPESVKTSTASSSFADLEPRIEALEKAFEFMENTDRSVDGNDTMTGMDPLKERVARLETAFSAKFDSLLKRMEAIEKSISGSPKKAVAAKTSKPVAKSVNSVKKQTKTGLFHTIKKGETLYSISKKYNTTVTTIRQLNKLSADAKIYPGDSILVR